MNKTGSYRVSNRTHLDLHIEHSIRSDSESKGRLNMLRKSFFVALLNSGPLSAELLVFGEGQETFKFGQVFEPDALLHFECFGDELAEFGVALVEPATGGNCG